MTSETSRFLVGDRVRVNARDEGWIEGVVVEDRPSQGGCVILTDSGRRGGFGYSEMMLVHREESPTAWNRLGVDPFDTTEFS